MPNNEKFKQWESEGVGFGRIGTFINRASGGRGVSSRVGAFVNRWSQGGRFGKVGAFINRASQQVG